MDSMTIQPQSEVVQADRWMTIQEASEFIGLGVPSIRAMIKSGHLPAYRIGRRSIRIREEDALKWAPRLIDPASYSRRDDEDDE